MLKGAGNLVPEAAQSVPLLTTPTRLRHAPVVSVERTTGRTRCKAVLRSVGQPGCTSSNRHAHWLSNFWGSVHQLGGHHVRRQAGQSPASRCRPNQAGRVPTLLSWLSQFLATPTDAQMGKSTAEALERAVFAAAVIVARPNGWRSWEAGDRQVQRDLLAQDALAWLLEHLPNLAYAESYEAALSTMDLRSDAA